MTPPHFLPFFPKIPNNLSILTLPESYARVSLRLEIYLDWRSGRVAEGAPLLREYTVYPVSRVRIPPSPPYTQKSPLSFSRGLFCVYGEQERLVLKRFEPQRASRAKTGERSEANPVSTSQ